MSWYAMKDAITKEFEVVTEGKQVPGVTEFGVLGSQLFFNGPLGVEDKALKWTVRTELQKGGEAVEVVVREKKTGLQWHKVLRGSKKAVAKFKKGVDLNGLKQLSLINLKVPKKGHRDTLKVTLEKKEFVLDLLVR